MIPERRSRFVAAALAAIAPVACESKPAVPTAVPPATTAVASAVAVPDSVVAPQDIVIRARVLFAENVATPPPTAREILDEVARGLHGEPAIGVAIVGRSAPGESEGVAYARANLVRSSLVARGIPDVRLRLDTDAPPAGEERIRSRSVGFRVFVLP
jgi:outer membrane protein OmpA-like peptidoglycan-associated protein